MTGILAVLRRPEWRFSMFKVGLMLALFVLVSSSSPANAELSCASRADIVGQLIAVYKEKQRGAGVAAGGAVVELWISKDGETWTLVVTTPAGTACVIATGESWQTMKLSSSGSIL